VDIHRSARKHGFDDTTIAHAVDHAIVVVDLEPDSDPPRVLAIGPDRAGNLLEVIWVEARRWPDGDSRDDASTRLSRPAP
jgi:hypothetical protein